MKVTVTVIYFDFWNHCEIVDEGCSFLIVILTVISISTLTLISTTGIYFDYDFYHHRQEIGLHFLRQKFYPLLL
jgi:hypothetical protein